MSAAHQVSEFTFDFGAGRPVVGPPDRILLPGARGWSAASWTPMAIRLPALGGGELAAQRAGRAVLVEDGFAVGVAALTDRHSDAVRAADGAGIEVDRELFFGEQPAWRRCGLSLAPRPDPGVFEERLELAGPVRVVAIDRTILTASADQIDDQILGNGAVTGVAGVTIVSVTI